MPFPYINVKDFAASIAAPIGKDWNPQTVVKELTKPKIATKLGTIIKPINRSVLLNQKAESKNVPKPPTLQKKHKQRHKRQKKKK